MEHTTTIAAEASAPRLEKEIMAAFAVGRISVILCVLTLFMAGFCAAHLVEDVLEGRPLSALAAPEEGMPCNLAA